MQPGGTILSDLVDRLRDFRNRKVADPAFRRWAARFPLTRTVARRQAKALFDLTAGFVYSQVLHASVKVGLFHALAAGPLDIATISARIGLPLHSAEKLLKAAAALGLVEARAGDRFALGALGAALVHNEGVQQVILHHDILYDDLRDPLALLAGKGDMQLRKYWSYCGEDRDPIALPRGHAEYTRLMAASQAMITAEVLDAYRFDRYRRLLDVGGGDGSFLIAAGRAAAALELSMFDLPPVAEIARQRILEAGLASRATVHGGSFFDEELPQGADVVTLNRVLHDHDDDRALALLEVIRRAIAPQGTLLIAEPMAGTRGAEASGDAYFGFYLMAMGQGRPRSFEEIRGMLERSGFGEVREITTNVPLIARIASARPANAKPANKGRMTVKTN
ncbi:MAG: methyltransferase domain-containing protein [Rhizobiaceae bacterium]|nr:methyltransferase domain-containing protein [Rhizobiaceae bacterium]